MAGKNIFNRILYFLGIEDEYPVHADDIEDYQPYSARNDIKQKGRVINIHQSSKNKMVIYKPTSFDEVREISDEVKSRRAVIVNMEKLDKENAKRVLDFMSGSIYALNGTVKKIGPGIFIFAPDNVDVSGTAVEENLEKSFSLK
ncbi:MAG: cell division protein SepF [Tepidanaerobacteraceae bacterium]|nr:cell division protein SepF [Tepidanaerobacteraceae bacterium]